MDKIYSIDEIKVTIHSFDDVFRNEFKVLKFYIFGSYAKGEQTVDSDIDLLVEFDSGADLLLLVRLKKYLQNLFKKNVDIGTPAGLKPVIKDSILKEAVLL